MTKKQNRRKSGFGKRSLSVLLATLIVLSTLVVMLTSTMLTASAAISYWNVAGNFNSWESSLNNTTYRINGGSGSVTFSLSSDSYSSITFKMCAYEDGWKWCGNSSGSASVNSETELSWNGGNDITLNLPSGTTQVTFRIDVRNQKNYLTVTANGSGGSGGSGGGGDTGQMYFDAPVNENNPDNSADDLFWANATYFDYLSDRELTDGWLKPIQAGTKGFGGSVDEWYPFYVFNRNVVKNQADVHSDWAEPLYFGNFCDTNGAYDTPHHQNGTDSYGYREATNSSNVTRFKHIANNSDYNQSGSAHLANMNCSYQGLVSDHLSSSGDLLLPNGQVAPYFNANEDTPLKGYAKIVNSSFPFKVSTIAGTDVKKYSFNSANAQDNVYFTWATESGVTKPVGVNYGAGTTYGVKDGISRFMYNQSSGYGIFPFNNASSNYKGTKTNANENLNYGFGIKTQMRFRVPKPNADSGINTDDNPIYFRFSGDDDLWMYITDESGNSQLVLDMGGDHKQSTGQVNFSTLTSTVDKVGTGGGPVTTSFDFDYEQTYTMTVCYMERGLIESNSEMEFTMYPAGNMVTVEKEVNTASINHTSSSTALQDAVAAVDTFNFTSYQSEHDSANKTALTYTEYLDSYGNKRSTTGSGVFSLKDGEKASFLTKFTTNNDVYINESNPNTAGYLRYTTKWNVSDPGDTSRNRSNQSGLNTTAMQLKHPTEDPFEYAQLDYKFVNTPRVGTVTVSKNIPGATSTDRAQTFNAKVEISLTGKNGPYVAYPLSYTASDLSGTYETTSSGYLASNARLKHGRTLTFKNLPSNAYVKVTESLTTAQKSLYSASYQGGVNSVLVPTSGSSTITVVNTPKTPDAVTGYINGYKLLNKSGTLSYYNGDMFKFIEEGVARSSGDPANIKDTSGTYDETTTVTNGVFRFSDITFEEEGVYRYHVYEDTSYLAASGAAFEKDFSFLNTHYLVEITVTKVNNKLTVSQPVYYNYEPPVPASTEPTAATVNTEITSADFDPSKLDEDQTLIIYNVLKDGSLRIEKEDQQGNKMNKVTFAVYKVDEDMDLILSGHQTGAEKYDALLMHINLEGIAPAASAITGRGVTGRHTAERGVAFIDDLPIYKDEFINAAAAAGGISTINKADFNGYQKYVLLEVESAGTAGYSVNKTVGVANGTVNSSNVFSFPINDQYDFTYSFINTELKSPSASGTGMALYKLLGMGIALISVFALGGFMLYHNRFAGRKTAKHFRND